MAQTCEEKDRIPTVKSDSYDLSPGVVVEIGEGLRSGATRRPGRRLDRTAAILEQVVGRLLACRLRALRGLVVCGLNHADVFDYC